MQASTMERLLNEELLAREQSLYRLAMSYMRNPSDAMDVVQEAACKAIRAKYTLKDPSMLRPWLYRIVANTALDALRRSKRETTAEVLPEQSREDDHSHAELFDVLSVLDEKSRTAIILRYFEDLRVADVAFAMGENLNTTKTRLRRALGALRLELTDAEIYEEGAHAGQAF